MKLGVISVLLADMETGAAMKYIADAGAEAVEIGCGRISGKCSL